MKIVYASRTGNTEYLVTEGLKIDDALKIEEGDEIVNEPYVLFVYTDIGASVPYEAQAFLENNSANLRGVIGCGDRNYGENFCKAGYTVAEQYKVPLLYTIDTTGTEEDYEAIKKILENL